MFDKLCDAFDIVWCSNRTSDYEQQKASNIAIT